MICSNEGVVQKHFGELISSLLALLAKKLTSTALQKSLVTCLGTALRRGATYDCWENQDAKEIGDKYLFADNF